MKVRLSVTIDIDESEYPNLTKSQVRSELEGNFNSYMQQVEEETKNLLADMNTDARKK